MTTLNTDVQTFRLACDVADPASANSLVRAYGPLSEMARQDRRLELISPRASSGQRDHPAQWELSWEWLACCDALFLQAPWSPAQVNCCVQAKLMGLPIWTDWDNDYGNLPRSHPHYPVFSRPEVLEGLGKLAELADIVTVTTHDLKRKRTPVTRNSPTSTLDSAGKVRVLPNACQWRFSDSARQPVVTWRGSPHHAEDLATVLPQLAEVSRSPRFNRWKWHFLGDPSWQVYQAIPADRLIAGFKAPPPMYMDAFARLGPWLHIVPLANNGFNRSKSNLAWLEATAAGAVVLAPALEEWQRPGIVNYKDASDFGNKLSRLMDEFNAPGCHPNVTLSRAYIRENLSLRCLNAQRWEILNELWKLRRPSVFACE